MTTEVINIQIREDGSRVVSRNLDNIGKSADKTSNSLDHLKGLIATVITGAAVVQLGRLADEYTNLQNRLRLVTTGTENLSRVTKELQNIANQTRSDFTATGELYARLASTTKELGLSQQQMLSFTKQLNQAIVLSGATASEAAGGLRQLSQGLASGTLRGDELNSVLENFPKVAQIIAEGMGHTIGEIRKLGAEGKISAQAIIDAFAKANDQLEADFATTVPTLSQSFTVLKNNFLIFIGQLNESTGITATFSELIIKVANNLDTILPVLAGVAAAVALAFSIEPITKFANALKALYVTAMANPFVAIATVILGVVTALYLMRDQIKLGIDETTTLGDLMRAAWESVGPAIEAVMDLAAQFFGWLTDTSAGTFAELVNDVVGYEHESEAMWLKLLRIVVQIFDMIGATVRGTFMGLIASGDVWINHMIGQFKRLGDMATGAMSGDWDAVKTAWDTSGESFDTLGTRMGDAFSSSFQAEVLAQSESGLESYLNKFIDRAAEISKERLAKQGQGELGGGGPNTIKPPVDADAAKKAARELEKLKNALGQVLDQANPVEAAQRRLAEAQGILTRAVQAGLITQEKATSAYENLEYQLRDALDPLAALNRGLDEHIDLLRLSGEQAEIEQTLLSYTKQLRQDGIKLTEDEIAQLRAKLAVEQELNRIAQVRDQLESQSQARRTRDLVETTNTAAGMVGQNGYTAGDAVNAVSDAGVPGLDNTSAQLATRQELYATYYATIDELRQQDLLSETEAVNAKIAIFQQQYAAQFQAASQALGNLAQLQKSENKKQAAIGKAAAIAQTIINTYSAATASYNAMAGIPYVGPFLGAAAAAAAVVAGMANVQAIRSQSVGFRTGGNMTVGGSGGSDSQLVSFRATPGEKINVNTPAQAAALERLGREGNGERGPRNINVNQNIVVAGRMDKRTPDQLARAARRETRKEFERSGS